MSFVANLQGETCPPQDRGGGALLLTRRIKDLFHIRRVLERDLNLECMVLEDFEQTAASTEKQIFDLILIDIDEDTAALEAYIQAKRKKSAMSGTPSLAIVRSSDNPWIGAALRGGVDDVIDPRMVGDLLSTRMRNTIDRHRWQTAVTTFWTDCSVDHEQRHAAEIFDTLPDPVLVLSPDSMVEVANQAACRLFGLSKSALSNMKAGDILARAVQTPQGLEVTAKTLLGPLSQSVLMALLPTGTTKPVELSAVGYRWFGQDMCVCRMREINWTQAWTRSSAIEDLKFATQLWGDIANESLHRLEEAGRHIANMRDQVFGPTGAPIYRSLLTDALCSLDQARHLLQRQADGGSERRQGSLPATPFLQMAQEALANCQSAGHIRQVAHQVEFAPSDLQLRLPRERFVELLTALLGFTTEATECGETITLRAQVASDRRLLLMVDAGGAAVSPAQLSNCCHQAPKPELAASPLTVSWNDARVAVRRLGGRLELSLDHPRGGFNVMAFLPQRRDGDAA